MIWEMRGNALEIVGVRVAAVFEDMAGRVPGVCRIERLIGYERTLDVGEECEGIIRWGRALARHAKGRP